MAAGDSLKDTFDPAVVDWIAGRVSQAYGAFPKDAFVQSVTAGLAPLPLMARKDLITQGLADGLPGDFAAAVKIVLDAIGEDDGTGGMEGMDSFRYLPFVHFVGVHGLDDVPRSLDALHTLTKYFSAEFDIRPFLLAHPAETLARLSHWVDDPDWRVRRLVSEGTRPRLPWGMRLRPFIDDPSPVLRLLERMMEDGHPTVRRSVANNLNDIAKDHPDTAVAFVRPWADHRNAEVRRLVRHALRTLVKKGHQGALSTLGFSGGGDVAAEVTLAVPVLAMGGTLDFGVTVKSREEDAVNLVVDYAIHFVKANGKRAAKVFKLKAVTLPAGEEIALSGRYAFVEKTTFRHYPGEHALEILVNGRSAATVPFVVTPAA